MEPNNSSIYDENREYFQILENQREKKIDKLIGKTTRACNEVRLIITRAQKKTPVKELPAQIRYYERKFAMDNRFQGNVASDLQLAEIQGK